ncbi:MAG: hypothetical protein B6244_08780 [Candidatus Cloacimonetes bacterium 4572_55]|nr:MAG: hypothetical protein B6244_08780 [Candidatus Cloacimonetes bacterium 4572_55]
MAQHSPSHSLKATINRCLIDFVPKSIDDIQKLMADFEKKPPSPGGIELILEGNPNIYVKNADELWSLRLENFPEHKAAYEILKSSTKMLTTLQLKRRVASKQPRNQRSQIVLNLEKDDRFVCYAGRKWTLKEKVNIGDFVYNYLKNLEEPVTERKLLRIVSNQSSVDPGKALFDPVSYGDKRLYKDKNSRWFLTEKRQVPPTDPASEKPAKRKLEALPIEPEKMHAVENLFDEETPRHTIDEILRAVFRLKPEDETYEAMNYSLIRALKRNSLAQSISIDDKKWTLDSLIPVEVKKFPELKPETRIRMTPWLEFGDDDFMKGRGLTEDEMMIEAQFEERQIPLSPDMQIERVLSSFEHEYGILCLRPCDRPFFPEKPTYIHCHFQDELNTKYDIFINNKLNMLYGLKEWYNSIENPFAARFFIFGDSKKLNYRLLYKRETASYHQLPTERIEALKQLWERTKKEDLRISEIVLEVMRQHVHGTDSKRLLWEVNSIRHTPKRTVYGILSYFQCFSRRKGTDRWYLNEKLICKGSNPEKIKYLEKLTKPRLGDWVMSPKSSEKFDEIINTFKDWEGREAYFAFHERTQCQVRTIVKKIVSKKPRSEDDLKKFCEQVNHLFNTLNWRKNDPESGCWNLVLINTDKWGIFHTIENAESFIDLLESFLMKEDAESLDQALSQFINRDIRGIQSATLSPLLFCLQPQLFSVINKSIITGFERLTGYPLSPDLHDYMTINSLMREFLKKYELFDFSDVDGFFSHCISGHLELEDYDDLMKIPPIKKAMDLLTGEFEVEENEEPDEKEESKPVEENPIPVKSVQLEKTEKDKVDKSMRDRISHLANQLFSTEDLYTDLARQLREIRIQGIWQTGDLAENFIGFLDTNFSRPQQDRFLTPPPLARLAVRLLKPKITEKSVDLCMGCGGFLTAIARYLKEQFEAVKTEELEIAIKITLPTGETVAYSKESVLGGSSIQSEEGKAKLFSYIVNQNIFGIDIDSEAIEAAKINLNLNNFFLSNIGRSDALDKNSVSNMTGSTGFDVGISHPPSERSMGKRFIKEFLRALKPEGRLAIVLPKDGYRLRRLNAWKRDILRQKTIAVFIELPSWDESKYGPESILAIFHGREKKAPQFKATLDKFENAPALIESYEKSLIVTETTEKSI